ncbi:unnamed protein product [marine sediment metagenome]|uniref:Uncharacterized protein n=1 Tax=marine sediment metagenome TaxID=412755 RepID=X0WAM5_9ZZZZ
MFKYTKGAVIDCLSFGQITQCEIIGFDMPTEQYRVRGLCSGGSYYIKAITVHDLNKENMIITWDLNSIELQETLKGDWGDFSIDGKGEDGNNYNACLQTWISSPEIDDLTGIIKL